MVCALGLARSCMLPLGMAPCARYAPCHPCLPAPASSRELHFTARWRLLAEPATAPLHNPSPKLSTLQGTS